MAVADTDVYITGSIGPNSVYWKNGVVSELPISARCVAVSATGVYFAGINQNVVIPGTPYPAAYLKNGVYNVLPSLGSVYINTAAIVGNDVYFAGCDISSPYSAAVYWKNGTEYTLPTISNPALASVSSMAISGNDVYFAGYDDGQTNKSVYWKNGVEHVLPSTANTLCKVSSEVMGMAISGTDIYFAGWDFRSAVYWKNGAETILPFSNSSSISGSATGIAVAGTDIYVAGTESNFDFSTSTFPPGPSTTLAEYWKNGKTFVLPLVNSGNGNIVTMAVVSK